MKAFMKSFGPSASAKEKLITDNLVNKLSESVKYIQMTENSDDVLVLLDGDGSTALCTVLEAVFLHGIKDTLFQLATKAFTSEIDQRPQPSFWSFLLVFSHKQIISQIQSLTQVTTEVGYCRAWLRIALNDNLLSSYLASIKRDSHVLKQFYKQHAFLRDPELLDLAQNLINGIETISSFNLAINSSLLNYWSHPPLLMAGLWSTTLKSCPISSGVDIAMSLEAMESSTRDSDPIPAVSASDLLLESSGIGQLTALNEGEALRIILQKSTEFDTDVKESETSKSESESNTATECSTVSASTHQQSSDSSQLETSSNTNNSSGFGNSLSGVCGWSSENSEAANTAPALLPTPPAQEGFSEASYNALVDNYNVNVSSKNRSNSPFKWVEEINDQVETTRVRSNTNDSLLQSLGYEVIPSSATSQFSSIDFTNFLSHLGTLAREKGLDKQKYVCGTCGNTLGISFAKPKVCSFTGEYFCEDCMSPTTHTIPAKIIFNWDFRKYPVSRRALSFIIEFKNHPLINLKIMNPNIYSLIDKMAELQGLRIQLNFLRAYLYTCREPVVEQLQRKVWPREYLYECIHQYSISDLEQIPDNELTNQLKQIVLFARAHVSSCWLCSQKGFICEICDVPKVLYPFDLGITFRCEVCNAVFHKDCIDRSSDCPKCERKRQRFVMP